MSMSYLEFENTTIDYIIDEIDIKKNSSYSSNNYVGSSGSDTSYISESGLILTFSNLCPFNAESLQGNNTRVEDYLELAETYKDKIGVVVSESNANINGNYKITKCDIVEDTGRNIKLNWTLTEIIPFNVTKQTFRVWGNTTTTTTTTSTKTVTTTTTSGSNINSNTKYLLKTCGLMSRGSSATKCVKILQKFLQALGYYKGYKLDGVYGVYTFKEMKKLQKKYGIKQTGNWDKTTRTYFQKKYKYP